MDGKSLNTNQEQIEKLKILFPEVVSDGKVDFEKLKKVLGNFSVSEKERYGLSWANKSECFQVIQTPTSNTLKPILEESIDFENTGNIFIEGENLEVLKILQRSYHGKIKMIYIDPPYNTGNDSFIYPDKFSESKDEYLKKIGEKSLDGEIVFSKFYHKNNKENGHYHSNWLSMMFTRLYLARNLLKNDGVIFVSIDDNELHHLRVLMNEIFGEENYINTITIRTKPSAGASGGGEDKRLKKNAEYLLMYVKNLERISPFSQVTTQEPLLDVIEEMRDNEESWKYTSIMLDVDSKEFVGEILDGEGNPIKIYKKKNLKRTTINKVMKDEGLNEADAYKKYFHQIFSDTNAQSSIRTRVIEKVGSLADSEILEVVYVPRSGKDKGNEVRHTYISNTIRRVIWLNEVAEVKNDTIIKKEKLGTLWSDFNWNNVSKEGNVTFPNGKKPIDFIKRMLELSTTDLNNDIVLDFFSGSGSTAHAVMDLNQFDNGNRKFICIQLPVINGEMKNSLVPDETVADICKKRIRNVIEEYKKKLNGSLELNGKQDLGVKVFKLSESNFEEWKVKSDSPIEEIGEQLKLQINSTSKNSSDLDILYELLVKAGFLLDTKIQKHSYLESVFYSVDDSSTIFYLDKKITLEVVSHILELKPKFVFILDESFTGNDVLKTNTMLRFKDSNVEFISV